MTHSAFNTLKFLQKLKASGMPEQHAIALTEAQNEIFLESTDHMIATKADIFVLKQDIMANITAIESNIVTLESTLKVHNWMMSFVLAGIATLIPGTAALILKAFS